MGESYRLGFPNREVKKALLELVVPNMLNANKEETENAIQGLKPKNPNVGNQGVT